MILKCVMKCYTQNVHPFKYYIESKYVIKYIIIPTSIQAQKYGKLFSEHNMFSISIRLTTSRQMLTCVIFGHKSVIMQCSCMITTRGSIKDIGFLICSFSFIKFERKKSHGLMSGLQRGLTCPQSWRPAKLRETTPEHKIP